MHRTNRYKIPAKREAYEVALRLAGWRDKLDHPDAFLAISKQLDPGLSHEHRRQVAAKAVRVERGRRKRAKEKISKLKRTFDDLVAAREEACQRIDPDVEGTDVEYLRLEQEVNEAYRQLMDARYDVGQGMLD